MTRRIAVFTGNRAEYGLLHPILRALTADPFFEVTLLVTGSHLDEEFGNTRSEIESAGVKRIVEIPLAPRGTDHAAMAASMGELIPKVAALLREHRAELALISGDRYEGFAAIIAAFYQTVPIAHLFGGDLSQGGHLDDSVRHSVTKLAHIHFVTNEDSRRRVLGLGEEEWRVHNVGSPVVDNALSGEYASADELRKELGIVPGDPLVLFTQHPVTTESDLAYSQARESLEALKELGYRTIITWPCNDAGSAEIIRAIEEYRRVPHFILRKNLGWRNYLGVMRLASVVAGNSSSGLIETPAFGVPAVDIGNRQKGRLRAGNVTDVACKREAIRAALKAAVEDPKLRQRARECVNPYGGGGTSAKIVSFLKSLPIDRKLLQKRMTY